MENIQLTLPEMIILSGIVIAILIFFIFSLIIIVISSKTSRFSRMMPTYHSECYIDIEKKIVIIKEVRAFGWKEFSYELDDFIYMLSINPDSKPFRELLKIVRNGATKQKIKKAIKEVNSVFMYVIDYNDGRRSLSYNIFNKEQDFTDKIYFQMSNNELVGEKKSSIKKDFLDGSLTSLTDSELFLSLSKEAKKFMSKGVTLVKVTPKYSFIETNKDYLLNRIQTMNIKNELLSLGFKSFQGTNGSIYGVISNDRRKSHNSIQKQWNNTISNLFNKKKRSNEYLDANIENYVINTYSITTKDSNAINEALIFINIASEYSIEFGNYSFDEVIEVTKKISKDANHIIEEIREKKPKIKIHKSKIEERGIKPFNEIFLDFSREVIEITLNYSFRDKREIITYLLEQANKASLKIKTENIIANINEKGLKELPIILKDLTLKPNIYIGINEFKKVNHLKYTYIKIAEFLKDNNIKIAQNIKDENGGNIHLYRIFNPEYVILAKGLNDSTVLSDKFKLNLLNIENTKTKETKIINVE